MICTVELDPLDLNLTFSGGNGGKKVQVKIGRDPVRWDSSLRLQVQVVHGQAHARCDNLAEAMAYVAHEFGEDAAEMIFEKHLVDVPKPKLIWGHL